MKQHFEGCRRWGSKCSWRCYYSGVKAKVF